MQEKEVLQKKKSIRTRIHLYFNKEERNLLDTLVERTNLKRSSYIRELIKNQSYIQQREEIIDLIYANKELLRLLQNISNNINQITYALHSDIYQSQDTIIKELNELKIILFEHKKFIQINTPTLIKHKAKINQKEKKRMNNE